MSRICSLQGVLREHAVAATGWSLQFADDGSTTAPPTADGLDALGVLQAA